MDRHLRSRWRPGEHFAVFAPTGHGKTFLIVRGLLPRWRYVLTLDVKGDDPELAKAGRRVRTFPSAFDIWKSENDGSNADQHYRLHPGGIGPAARHAFDDALRRVWRSGKGRRSPTQGTWTVNVDETRIMADNLKLEEQLKTLLILGRSKGITVICGSQSPRFLPGEVYDQPTWHAIGPIRDQRTQLRLAEIGGDTDLIRAILPTLERSEKRREWLILGPDGFQAITSWEPPGRLHST